MNAPSLPASDSAAIAAEAVTVRYRALAEQGRSSFSAGRFGWQGRSARIVEALQDVSFTVPGGSVLGVIGRNGAGKSTLLRTIAGILPPSQGRVVVRGQISTLLARGIGCNRELTGRENILLGGLAAGLTYEEVSASFDEISAFTELGEYLDHPVRTYSSGMASRLSFAVAIHLDPDILIVDEALSAGDGGFKEKCARKVRSLCGEGRTMVLVSHGLGSIRELATECLWLHQGRVAEHGPTDDVVSRYMKFCRLSRSEVAMEDV
jgi:teichoic acid transport system ATP-binding protein